MFLTSYNLPHYLISKGMLPAQSVVDGDFMLAEAGRRNRNFKVIRRKQRGLFVKQIKSTEAQAVATIQREAAFYRRVCSDPKYGGIRALIPQFVDYDERRYALTVGLVRDAESIAERSQREPAYKEDTARCLGDTLGRIHGQGPAIAADPELRRVFTGAAPWPLMLDQTGLGFLDNLTAVGRDLSTAIRQMPHLQRMLSGLRAHWQYDSLIHGDMKWDNCLIQTDAAGTPQITIVDWELVDLGDGAWDVAGILKEYVVLTVFNAPRADSGTASAATTPQLTLEALQPSVRAFWQAYVAARRLPNAAAYFERAVLLTGARMVIAILEYLAQSPQLGALGMAMLQTSANILEAPQIAAAQLMGTPARMVS